ncbi:Thioredoxin family protein [Babesia bovis T2Bo]|uniref:Thioredoxin domain containing protein, putative n=1 Tax=Babesia bovis TaxID=5865 RepID=A7AUZ1_BABBO|nr:Thioredoxin family protein [Babesia bovis T2Bo]EDO05617.1 Thioredoxin family protein [Babesia bovis T2Bo]|eukprot:XP_001609185.1 thioredoxin domain containing protein [Babesia bovis T2Bo]
MGISKEVLSFANTAYLLEAAGKKHLEEAKDTPAESDDGPVLETAPKSFDDLESWRRERLADIRRKRMNARKYMEDGHGKVDVVTDEKEVINICNSHKRVICHFYNDEFTRCKILHRHLSDLAAKHLEVKFIMIEASKSPFFTQKLQMQVLPTMISVIDGNISHVFIGFEEFKGDMITLDSLRAGLLKRGAITTECCDTLDENGVSEDSD